MDAAAEITSPRYYLSDAETLLMNRFAAAEVATVGDRANPELRKAFAAAEAAMAGDRANPELDAKVRSAAAFR